jgi:hypothetical protein
MPHWQWAPSLGPFCRTVVKEGDATLAFDGWRFKANLNGTSQAGDASGLILGLCRLFQGKFWSKRVTIHWL